LLQGAWIAATTFQSMGLFESEFFGHARGSFSGARGGSWGLLSGNMQAAGRNGGIPTEENNSYGFLA
jgi:hypothetical protein